MFACLFAVNAKTTPRIDAKRWGNTMNDPESVLCELKSPSLVFSERYRDISGFSFSADRHFYLSPFYFRLLPRLDPFNTERFRQNGVHRAPYRNWYFVRIKRPSHLERKWSACVLQANIAFAQFNHIMHALHIITLKHCHIVATGMTLLQLPLSST